jgi:5-aminopentanamidase
MKRVAAAVLLATVSAFGAPLRIAVVQMDCELRLAEARDRIVRSIAQARERRARVAVFPEGALNGDATDTPAQVAEAVERIHRAARDAGIYVVYGGNSSDAPGAKTYNWMRVANPEGREIFRYDKLYDRRTTPMPGVFFIDGIPCNAMICADRWLRGVEELPIAQGARISFELSNNLAVEWVPALEWYWYVPRALRTGAWVVFANSSDSEAARRSVGGPKHGHSAVIGPRGKIVAAAHDDRERMLVTEIDPEQATRGAMLERTSHPALRAFWEGGLEIMAGRAVAAGKPVRLESPEVEVKLAAAQMACSRRIEANVGRIEAMLRQASAAGADLVAFPELALTGANRDDVARASSSALDAAMEKVRSAVASAKVYAVVGAPHREGRRLHNSAFVIGPDGAVLTRYDQMAVEPGGPFEAGADPHRMWFRMKGVPGVVTVGRDALWNEIAEMTAQAGAQLHAHIAQDSGSGADAALRRMQVWSAMASFKTFTVTVNGAAPAGGGSAVWDDLNGHAEVRAALKTHRADSPPGLQIYSPWSANCIVRAGAGEQLIQASRKVNRNNPHRQAQFNPQMLPWYELGASLMGPGPEF